jgi:hypothetical protein
MEAAKARTLDFQHKLRESMNHLVLELCILGKHMDHLSDTQLVLLGKKTKVMAEEVLNHQFETRGKNNGPSKNTSASIP